MIVENVLYKKGTVWPKKHYLEATAKMFTL